LGMELLFIVSVLTWLGIFLYLLALHVRQRKLSRTVDRILDLPSDSEDGKEP
jgi:CcmD family protein